MIERRFLRGLLYLVAAIAIVVAFVDTGPKDADSHFQGWLVATVAIAGLACSTARGAPVGLAAPVREPEPSDSPRPQASRSPVRGLRQISPGSR